MSGRIRTLNDADLAPDGDFILYWMVAARRISDNYALDRARAHAREFEKPLVILEALRCDYRWASDRPHRFVLDGMADNAGDLEGKPPLYYPYVEPKKGAGKGLLEALAKRACVVVTDEFPSFFIPRMQAAAAKRLQVPLEVVDGCGIFPLYGTDRVFTTAHSFRRFLQKTLPDHLGEAPSEVTTWRNIPDAPSGLLREEQRRWEPGIPDDLSGLPIDHDVAPAGMRGGAAAGRERWETFLHERLGDYATRRNVPDEEAPSGLSPYLHFGHISPHRVLADLLEQEGWDPGQLSPKTDGSRRGWWGLSESAEGFLDQIVTWRELGYNRCAHTVDFDRYESLPDFALDTLEDHADDERPHVYTLDQFERAATHDPLWNAAQRELRRDGRIHNYLRMLWGKKILEWSATPRDALATMIELNNKYALDGRNPNSYSGIFWVLGRYDRAWGPECPIFGKVRYMTSKNTAKKVSVKQYLKRYGAEQELF